MTFQAHHDQFQITEPPVGTDRREDPAPLADRPHAAGIAAQPRSMNTQSELDAMRIWGVSVLTFAGWAVTLLLIALSLLGGPSVLIAGLVSAGLNFASSLYALASRNDWTARLAVAAMAAFKPALVLFALDASGYASDTHLAFFFTLAALSILCDVRVIALAAGIMVAQYLVAGSGLLADVLPGASSIAGSISGAVLQSLRTLVVAGLACAMIVTFRRVLDRLEQAKADIAHRAETMRVQTAELEAALLRAEQERQQREQAQIEQARARKIENNRIALEFEASISVVTHAISRAADVLEETTQALNTIARDTGESAAEVSQSAAQASTAARTVAQGVAELSSSIANIAGNVSKQNDLASQATQRSVSGGKAVGDLAQHSETIGEATRAIVRIAERTNLVSLNAAIEAACAGPAGRGFTIVAQEVKALASQASEAATEIDAFLKGVRSGTHEAERSFKAIDSVISDLAKAATAIRWDVEYQSRSADTIEDYARAAAEDVNVMAQRSKALANTASSTQKLSAQLDRATADMLRNVRDLEQSTAQFVANLKQG